MEGGGKTLVMTAYSLMHRARGYKEHGQPNPVLAFPGYYLQDGREPDPDKRERWSTEIDPAQALLIQNLPRKALLDIDEAPQFFDSMLFGATTSRLFGQVGTQRRKLDLTIYYTAQNWLHVHPRIRFATHFLIVCKDQWFNPQQREEGRQQGQFINITIWDVKGMVTGAEWTCMGMATVFGHHYWNYYDTEGIVDASEGMLQVQTRKRKVVFDTTQAGGPRIYKPGEMDEDDAAPFPNVTGDPADTVEVMNRVVAGGGSLKLQAMVEKVLRGKH